MFAYDANTEIPKHIFPRMPNNEPQIVPSSSVSNTSGSDARSEATERALVDSVNGADADALFNRGMAFRNAEMFSDRDSEEARVFLLAAATLNHAEAQFELCHLLGEYSEWPEAVAWLE